MLRETLQTLTDLPPIPAESRRLIAIFLDVNQCIEELAQELNEDIFDVVQKLCDPAVKAWLAAMTSLKNNERRERALRTLDATLTNTTDRKLLHRASSRILRHLEVTRPSNKLDASMPRDGCPDDSPSTKHTPPTTITIEVIGEALKQHVVTHEHTKALPSNTNHDVPPTGEAGRCSPNHPTPSLNHTDSHEPSTTHPRAP